MEQEKTNDYSNPSETRQPQVVNEEDQENAVNPQDETYPAESSRDFTSEQQLNKATNREETAAEGGPNNYDIDDNATEETDDTSPTSPKVNP